MRWGATIVFIYINLAVWGMLSELGLPGGGLGTFAITLLLSFVAILAHEVGHAVIAHRQGAVVQSIVVMIFHLRLRPRRLRVIPLSGRGDVGGYVTYTFVDRWWTMRKEAIVAFAGPLSNFALAIFVLFVAQLAGYLFASGLFAPAHGAAPGMLPPDAAVVKVIFRDSLADIVRATANALAILSAGMGVANLLPFKGSDGETILRFLRTQLPRRR